MSASDDAQEIEDSMMEDYKNSSHRRVTFEPGDVSLKQAFTVKSRAEACVTIQEIRKFAFKVSITNMLHIFFRNKTFLFVKIEN